MEAVLNENYEDYGYMHILGAITTVDSEIELGTAVGWLDEGGKEPCRRQNASKEK